MKLIKEKRQNPNVLSRLFLMNQTKGAEKVMSVYWFVILFLVAGAIVYMVSIFYGNPYDVREIETNILMNNIADCLSENGKLILVDEDFRDNFLELCNINLNTKDYQEIQYYIKIEFLDFDTKEFLDYNISAGNINLKDNPNIGSVFSNSKSFYVLGNEDKDAETENNGEITRTPSQVIVKIFIAISKTKENVG